MSLESDFDLAWTDFLTGDWIKLSDNSPALRGLAAFTAASVKGLAAQMDLLRSELHPKGMDLNQ